MSTTESQQVRAGLNKVLETALQAPQLNAPSGMSLHPAMSTDAPPSGAQKFHPLHQEVTVLAKPVVLEDRNARQDKASGAWIGVGEGPVLKLRFNDIGALLSSTPIDFTGPAPWYYEPVKLGEVGGFPVYQGNGKEFILIHRGPKLPWRPHSVERYIQQRIAEEEKIHADFEKLMRTMQGAGSDEIRKANAERQARIDAMKQQLAELSDVQRQAGACESGKRRRGAVLSLDLTCGPGSRPLVEPDQAYFDPSAARTSLQVLGITTTWGVLPKNDRMPNALGRVLRASLQDMDLKALQAMLR